MAVMHRADSTRPALAVALVVVGAGLLITLGACASTLMASPRIVVRDHTVRSTVPGPTTTISYLLEVTVTPGVNGY